MIDDKNIARLEDFLDKKLSEKEENLLSHALECHFVVCGFWTEY